MTKCDRCGEVVVVSGKSREGWGVLTLKVHSPFGLTDREATQFDLCAECAKSFKDVFISEENAND